MENDVYKEYKNAHYAMWDWIAEQVKYAQNVGDELLPVRIYKATWIAENNYDPKRIIHDCFACTVCEQNCNKCPVKDVLDGCMDVWLDDVCTAFSDNDYAKAYEWTIKIRDGWR